MPRLNEEDLTSKDTQQIAGHSYRQIHQWDQNDLISDDNWGSAEWRKISDWNAIGLRVLADIRRHLGVPPTKQRALFRWRTGREKSVFSHLRYEQAEDHLATVSGARLDPAKWTEFCKRLFDLTVSGTVDLHPIGKLHALTKIANAQGDKEATHAQSAGRRVLTAIQSVADDDPQFQRCPSS